MVQTAGLCSTSLLMARDTRSRAEEEAAASAMARTRAPVRWEVAASSEELRPWARPRRMRESLSSRRAASRLWKFSCSWARSCSLARVLRASAEEVLAGMVAMVGTAKGLSGVMERPLHW